MYCKKSFSLQSMGETALKSHMGGKKHVKNAKKSTTPSIKNFVSKPVTSPTPDLATSVQTESVAKEKQSVTSFVSGQDVSKAELIWTLHTVQQHNSYNSNCEMSEIFKSMFPDSEIARKFSCGRTKTAYTCCFGLAPHFSKLLTDRVQSTDNFVLLFDESLNKETQTKQLDVHVRLWNGMEVETRYLDSKFMGHSTALDLLDHFMESAEKLNLKNLFQVSNTLVFAYTSASYIRF